MYYVYILATQNNAVLYTGVTNNLERRLGEHKSKLIPGFTKKYNVTKLVYFDFTNDVNAAIAQEKRIKGWSRAKKNALIEERNPNWEELGVAEGDSSSLRSSE
ncbi:MAG: GIY-YIG nuclease family protein [Oscillospiraceae bacterium]|nr:GIY-YIG nuclease family protein [Oscillospiraceae bacterium]